MVVIGDREMENNSASLRSYGAKFSTTISIDELKQNFADLAMERTPEKIRLKS
jgi:threonyl-tRNA synthetase